MARGSHSCAAEIDLGTTTPRKKPGPENLGSGDETRELHKTRVFHQIFNAADGPEKSGFRACLTEIRPKPPSINPQTRKKSHNQNPGFARKTQVTHSPIPGLSRVSPRSRVFPGCLCCVLSTYLLRRVRYGMLHGILFGELVPAVFMSEGDASSLDYRARSLIRSRARSRSPGLREPRGPEDSPEPGLRIEPSRLLLISVL